MARIAIVGPGAVGGAIAAWLEKTGRHEVVLCVRRPMAELTVTDGSGTFTVHPPVWSNPSEAGPVDWVLVATKAYDAASAATWFPGLCEERTRVAILQNGVEHRERFAGRVTAEKLVPVMVDCPAERPAPGHIRVRGAARLAVADDEAGMAFAQLFLDTPVLVARSADFTSVIWRKLCLNSAGAISALLLKPSGVMRDDAIAELARGMIRECLAVGRAEGAVLDDAVVEEVVQSYRAAPSDSVNSLHADRAAGRPMEVDARNGVIVRLGRKHGIPTPYNQMAAALLGAAD